MASKIYQPFSIICLALLILGLFAQSTEARFKGINPFCLTSDYKRICNKMVLGAANWHDATRNAVQAALNVANVLPKLVPAMDQALGGLAPEMKEEVMSTCRDTFDGAIDNLKGSLDLIEKNDQGGLNSYLSAAISLSDCSDAFDQFGTVLPPVVAKTLDTLTKEVSNCLAVSQQI